jgi:hypothetical protein
VLTKEAGSTQCGDALARSCPLDTQLGWPGCTPARKCAHLPRPARLCPADSRCSSAGVPTKHLMVVRHNLRMGLDIYVGPITRYVAGDWLTVVQQAGRAAGTSVQIVRATPEPADAITDPAIISEAIRGWQQGVAQALGGFDLWAEDITLDYWTDKPDWDGYGGLVLLAAYDEQPDLRPGARKRFGGKQAADNPRAFGDSAAYKAASRSPRQYPTLLSGVEWWLPIDVGPTVFEVPRPNGQPARMGRVDQLVTELTQLAQRFGVDDPTRRQDLRQSGAPLAQNDVNAAGQFGLAVLIELALHAQKARRPLLMDY